MYTLISLRVVCITSLLIIFCEFIYLHEYDDMRYDTLPDNSHILILGYLLYIYLSFMNTVHFNSLQVS